MNSLIKSELVNPFEALNTKRALHEFFALPHFTFLRKCAAIKKELHGMGFTEATIQVKNLPLGSNRYWLCYPDLASAYAYKVTKDEQGQLVAISNPSEARFQDHVDEFIEMLVDTGETFLFYENYYPIADPTSIEFYVYEDEKNGFEPSTPYLRKVKKAKEAVDELENESKQIFLTVKKLEDWLGKFKNFYWSLQLDWNYKGLHQFQGLYQWLQMLADDLGQLSYAREALAVYQPKDNEWLAKFDSASNNHFGFDHKAYQFWLKVPFILKQKGREFYLIGKEFETIYQFSLVYELESKRFRDEEE